MEYIALAPYSHNEIRHKEIMYLAGEQQSWTEIQVTDTQVELFQPDSSWAQRSGSRSGLWAVSQRQSWGRVLQPWLPVPATLGESLNLSSGSSSVQQDRDIYLAEFV